MISVVLAVPDSARTSVPRVTWVTLNLTVSSSSRRSSSGSAERSRVLVPVRVARPAGITMLFVPERL